MLAEAILCLAVTIYHEGRGEPLDGQKAIVNVVVNRSLESGKTICEEVKRKNQFSWYKPHKEKSLFNIGEENLYKFGDIALNAVFEDDNTNGAQFFHNPSVKPYWTKSMNQTARFGNHMFYKLPRQKKYSKEEREALIIKEIVPLTDTNNNRL